MEAPTRSAGPSAAPPGGKPGKAQQTSTWQGHVEAALVFDKPVPVSLLEFHARKWARDAALPQTAAPQAENEAVSGEIREGVASCKLCGVARFEGGFEEQRRHFKSKWHEVNLALAAHKRPVVSEAEAIALDAQLTSLENNQNESSESNDDESPEESDVDVLDDEEPDASNDIVDSNWTILPLEKSGLAIRSNPAIATDKDELVCLLRAPQIVWSIILYRSGHFAACIFRNGQLIKHKTEHRYTQRRKQGGSQAAQDEKGFKARSAGAMLRRYGEQTMRERVTEVLGSWDWTQCDRIFLSVPEKCRKLFIRADKKKRKERTDVRFERTDERIRKVPFITSRPTLSECERVFRLLQTLELFVVDRVYNSAKATSDLQTNDANVENVSEVRSKSKDEAEDEPPSEFHDRRIHQIILEGDNVEELEIELDRNPHDLDAQNAEGRTPLHVACSFPDRLKCLALLLDAGADLLVKDVQGRTPYQRARDAIVRDTLRAFRGRAGEDYTDWNASQIPEPPKVKTAEELEIKRAKEREKKKRQAERKRDEASQRAAAQAEEQRRLEEERKAVEALGACSECKKAMPKKKSDRFKQGDSEFCSVECVRSHTRRVAADAAERRLRGNVS